MLHCSQAEQQPISTEQGGWGHLFLPQITSHIHGHVAKVWLNDGSGDNIEVLWECRAWPFTAIEQTPLNRVKRWQCILEYYGYTSDDASNLLAGIRNSELSTKRLQKKQRLADSDIRCLPEQAIPTELFLSLLAKVCVKPDKKNIVST